MTNIERTSISVIDEYIRTCPESVRATLQLLRAIISQEAPGAIEKISYGMPTFILKKTLSILQRQSGISGFTRHLRV